MTAARSLTLRCPSRVGAGHLEIANFDETSVELRFRVQGPGGELVGALGEDQLVLAGGYSGPDCPYSPETGRFTQRDTLDGQGVL